MHRIPPRFHPAVPIFPRIMIPEPVKHHVPDWLVPIDQHGLTPANPLFVDNQAPAVEIRDIQIRNLLQGSRVIDKTVVKHSTRRARLPHPAGVPEGWGTRESPVRRNANGTEIRSAGSPGDHLEHLHAEQSGISAEHISRNRKQRPDRGE